jgi:hypothetical protein
VTATILHHSLRVIDGSVTFTSFLPKIANQESWFGLPFLFEFETLYKPFVPSHQMDGLINLLYKPIQDN